MHAVKNTKVLYISLSIENCTEEYLLISKVIKYMHFKLLQSFCIRSRLLSISAAATGNEQGCALMHDV